MINGPSKPDRKLGTEALSYPFDWRHLQRKGQQIRRELEAENREFTKKKVAILGGASTQELAKMIDIFCLNKGVKCEFYESQYAQFEYELLSEKQSLIEFKPDIVFFHTTIKNIQNFPDYGSSKIDVDCAIETEFQRFAKLWAKCHALFDCVIIQNNFESPKFREFGNLDISLPFGKSNFVAKLNQRISENLQQTKNLYINDINYIAARIGLENWYDDKIWSLYRYACGFCALPYLANSLASIISAISGKSQKALVLDLDNTIWGGVIGDDGLEGISIGAETAEGEGYSMLQEYLSNLSKRGILLSVCSKNEFENAKLGFEHPDARLKTDDIVEIVANWEAKSVNLKTIIENLNIREESAVFIDDSAFERAEVKLSMPNIVVPELSSSPFETIELLDQNRYFEPAIISDEDWVRTKSLQGNQNRAKASQSYGTPEEFLASLEMTAEIDRFKPIYQERIVQLVNKTNQFNLTGLSLSLDQLKQISEDHSHITLYAKLMDKFGDSGLTSVLIAKQTGDTATITHWVMSCRVFSRGLELAIFERLVEILKQRSIRKLTGEYRNSSKNHYVEDLYNNLDFDKLETASSDGVVNYLLNLESFKQQPHFIKVHNA